MIGSALASSSSVSSLLLGRLREFFLIPMPFFCVLFEELGAVLVGTPATAASFLFSRFLAFFSFLHLDALSPP